MRGLLRISIWTLGALACAAPLLAQRTRAVIVEPGKMTRVIIDTMGTPYDVPFAPALAFNALVAVYADLKIPLDLRDSTTRQVGNTAFFRRGELGGRQISTFLSCGDGMTGAYADYYRVNFSLISTITPAGTEAATVRSVLLASAVNVTEGARQGMPCESTGRLEVRIHKDLLKKLIGIK